MIICAQVRLEPHLYNDLICEPLHAHSDKNASPSKKSISQPCISDVMVSEFKSEVLHFLEYGLTIALSGAGLPSELAAARGEEAHLVQVEQ